MGIRLDNMCNTELNDPLEVELSNIKFPSGISLAEGFENFPSIETIKTFIKSHTYAFSEELVKEVQASIAVKVSIIDAVSGSLLIHYLYLDAIKEYPTLKSKTQNVYAIQLIGPLDENGQDTKEHILSESPVVEAILIDDIGDTFISSKDIEHQVDSADYRMRVASTKAHVVDRLHPEGNGNIIIHIFAKQWIATCFGMNSGIGETDHTRENHFIRARMHEISILERTCCLPLAFDDKLAANWGKEQVQQYIDLLKAHSFFPNGEIPPELEAMYNAVIAFKNTVRERDLDKHDQLVLAKNLWIKLKNLEKLILQDAES